MAAHLRDIFEPECDRPSCPRRAKVELYDAWNARVGVYCRGHGAQELLQQTDRDRRVQRAAAQTAIDYAPLAGGAWERPITICRAGGGTVEGFERFWPA